MKLYGALASPYVARVVLFARLKGLELAPAMPEGGLKSATYLAHNPIGKMPVLEVEGHWFPESEVICELLEDLEPGRPGLPGSALDRAQARTVTRIFDLYLAPHTSVLFRNMNPAARDEAAVANAKQGFATGLGYLRHYVAAAPFAAGPVPSLADCALLPAFAIARKTIVPAFGVEDPTQGAGPLVRWWSTAAVDPRFAGFLAEYNAAVDAFLKMMAGG
ncbi:MAG TPA: glutathione S-transferase family protein [Steroidobacteraceae bacterium]|nr:glutathione S-transferase family protein [Steroidobacteraceae bacterium]